MKVARLLIALWLLAPMLGAAPASAIEQQLCCRDTCCCDMDCCEEAGQPGVAEALPALPKVQVDYCLLGYSESSAALLRAVKPEVVPARARPPDRDGPPRFFFSLPPPA